jgi:hypothetical protein
MLPPALSPQMAIRLVSMLCAAPFAAMYFAVR